MGYHEGNVGKTDLVLIHKKRSLQWARKRNINKHINKTFINRVNVAKE